MKLLHIVFYFYFIVSYSSVWLPSSVRDGRFSVSFKPTIVSVIISLPAEQEFGQTIAKSRHHLRVLTDAFLL